MTYFTLEYLRDCFITTQLIDDDVYDGSIRRRIYMDDKPVEIIEKFRIDNQGTWPKQLTRDVVVLLPGVDSIISVYLI